ncbi:hypothetical protein [Microscilla marina]|uniref:Uncharacterized protein n=1 Tax=Microscilla marina ATCC 23134 TaxID=313606 RepID=A1ZZI6_MICM2|nr:hypothetical protein [Microscilla marina]EAY24181.1 conserved hypothetical protein [Microscilla marina ATCC 23134]
MLDKQKIEILNTRLENLKVKIEFYSLLLYSDRISADKQKAQDIVDSLLDEFAATKRKLAEAEI